MGQIYLCIAIILSVIYYSDSHDIEKEPVCYYRFIPYKDEKCLKVFRSKEGETYDDIELNCHMKDALLLTIDFKDKQKFVEEQLRINRVQSGYVYIGLRYSKNKYQWPDGTEVIYTNWETGYPKKNPEYCVRMNANAGSSNYGKWSESSCSEKTYASICERLQVWSMEKLQINLINSIQNPVPIGFIYIQFPGNKRPNQIWPWMGWADVSKNYDSSFFRVLGSKSAPFGEKQKQSAPGLEFQVDSEYRRLQQNFSQRDTIDVPVDADDEDTWSDAIDFPWYHGLYSSYTYLKYKFEEEDEIVPSNMAVKIWRRVY